MKNWRGVGPSCLGLCLLALLLPGAVRSHCDTMKGPVVQAARKALEKQDLTPLLRWVQPDDEAEVHAAFKQALLVRKKGKEARDLADRWFFETVVRLHRAGEGAPFSGLSDAEVEPVLQKADRALESGDPEPLIRALGEEAAQGIRDRYADWKALDKHADESVDAGRKAVRAYVVFTHYVEGLHQSIQGEKAHPKGEPMADPHELGHKKQPAHGH